MRRKYQFTSREAAEAAYRRRDEACCHAEEVARAILNDIGEWFVAEWIRVYLVNPCRAHGGLLAIIPTATNVMIVERADTWIDSWLRYPLSRENPELEAYRIMAERLRMAIRKAHKAAMVLVK